MGHNYKNIKRNSTRPKASKRPFVQSMYGTRETMNDIKRMKEEAKEQEKLKSWNNLC